MVGLGFPTPNESDHPFATLQVHARIEIDHEFRIVPAQLAELPDQLVVTQGEWIRIEIIDLVR